MSHRISFLTYSEWDADRACMAFIALVDGRRARCLIRAEALVELAQKDAGSPILTFAESRESVEELARSLIQLGRLDGQELVIRHSDVIDHRSAAAAALPATEPETSPAEAAPATFVAAAPEPVPVVSVPAVLVNGRQMSMPDSDREEVWQSLCDRQRLACSEASTAAAGRAQGELEAFENRSVPESAHELNLRRVEATRMAATWRAETAQPSLLETA